MVALMARRPRSGPDGSITWQSSSPLSMSSPGSCAEELAVSRRHLRTVLDSYWDHDWRRHQTGDDDSPEDHLWRAASAVADISDALDELRG